MANSDSPVSGPRRLPSRWWISVCPGCNGMVGELTQAHLGDCEYRDTIFVPRSVEVSPAPTRLTAEDWAGNGVGHWNAEQQPHPDLQSEIAIGVVDEVVKVVPCSELESLATVAAAELARVNRLLDKAIGYENEAAEAVTLRHEAKRLRVFVADATEYAGSFAAQMGSTMPWTPARKARSAAIYKRGCALTNPAESDSDGS